MNNKFKLRLNILIILIVLIIVVIICSQLNNDNTVVENSKIETTIDTSSITIIEDTELIFEEITIEPNEPETFEEITIEEEEEEETYTNLNTTEESDIDEYYVIDYSDDIDEEVSTKDNSNKEYYFDISYDDVDSSQYDPNNVYGFTEDDIYLIAKIVDIEGGDDYISLEHQLLIACVVVNRVNSLRFTENTVEDIIYAPGQYYPRSSTYFQNLIPREHSIAIANYIVNNGVICPTNVCYQANFPQGSGIYKEFYVPVLGNNTYFCYE